MTVGEGPGDTTPTPLQAGRALLNLMQSQRACRRFSAEPVPDEALAAMIRAASHAPSAENRQPWIFVVVADGELRAAIDDLGRSIWRGGGRDHSSATLAPRFFADVDEFFASGHGGAPRLVVVAGDGRDGLVGDVLSSSVFPAVQNLLLAAAALGYGSTMTTLAAQQPAALAALLGLPDDVVPLAVLPVGRPERPAGPPRRRPVEEIAHRDRFGDRFTVEPP